MTKEKNITQVSYDASAGEYTLNVAELAPINEITQFTGLLAQGSTILDIGCGSGRDARIMSEMGFKVIGVDFSKKLIEIAKREAPSVEFHVMDIDQLLFEASSFDGIWASASLLHIPKENISPILKKIRAILKPNGIFYLSVKQGLGEGVEKDVRYNLIEKFWSYFEEEEIKRYLVGAEFTILKCSIKGIESAYQTHPWIKLLCSKKISVQK